MTSTLATPPGSAHISGPTFEAVNRAQAVDKLALIARDAGYFADVVSAGHYTYFVPGMVIITAEAWAWLFRVSNEGRLVSCEAAAWWHPCDVAACTQAGTEERHVGGYPLRLCERHAREVSHGA